MASSRISVVHIPEALESRPGDALVARLAAVGGLSPHQARILAEMQGPPQHVRARAQIGRIGGAAAYVIREGWAFAYTLLANGDRQVLGFLLPGDVVRLSDLFRAGPGCGIETVTETVVTAMSMESVRRASRQWPEIFEFFLRLQLRVQSALVEQLIDLGRRDSRARVAHLLLALEQRLLPIGHAGPDGYVCPLSQYLIADALGLTAIHVNRVLRALREDKLVTVRNDRVTIHDRARLMDIAGCAPAGDDGGAVVVPMNRRGPVAQGGRVRVAL